MPLLENWDGGLKNNIIHKIYICPKIFYKLHDCALYMPFPDCQSSNLGQLAWIIAVSIVGGVLVLGVVLLVVAKIILVVIVRYI